MCMASLLHGEGLGLLVKEVLPEIHKLRTNNINNKKSSYYSYNRPRIKFGQKKKFDFFQPSLQVSGEVTLQPKNICRNEKLNRKYIKMYPPPSLRNWQKSCNLSRSLIFLVNILLAWRRKKYIPSPPKIMCKKSCLGFSIGAIIRTCQEI